MSTKVLHRSLSSIHILYNQALVGSLSMNATPTSLIYNVKMDGGSKRFGSPPRRRRRSPRRLGARRRRVGQRVGTRRRRKKKTVFSRCFLFSSCGECWGWGEKSHEDFGTTLQLLCWLAGVPAVIQHHSVITSRAHACVCAAAMATGVTRGRAASMLACEARRVCSALCMHCQEVARRV